MRQSVRRRWFRIAFLLFCAAPTAATLLVWAARRSPPAAAAAKAALENRLASRSGLSVSLDQLDFPRPGAALLRGVQWSNPETGRWIGRARMIEVTAAGEGFLARVAQPEIQADALAALCGALEQRFFQSPQPPPSLLAAAGEMTLRAGPDSLTLCDLRCQLQSSEDARVFRMNFRLAGEPSKTPVRLCIERRRRPTPPATRWEFDTGPRPLPCSLLASPIALFRRFGAQCRFEGSFRAAQTRTGWEGELAGRFLGLDLDRLITDAFPHKLSGSADVLIRSVRFRENRIVSATGSLVSEGGAASRSLLLAAAESFGWTSSPRLASDNTPLWRYRRLAFQFTLDENGLALIGLGSTPSPDAILSDSQGALLSSRSEAPVPTPALLRVLAPGNELQAPVAKETEGLLRALPLPSARGRPPRTARATYHPLRLK